MREMLSKSVTTNKPPKCNRNTAVTKKLPHLGRRLGKFNGVYIKLHLLHQSQSPTCPSTIRCAELDGNLIRHLPLGKTKRPSFATILVYRMLGGDTFTPNVKNDSIL